MVSRAIKVWYFHLQVYRIACHSFLNAVRRCPLPGQRQTVFYDSNNSSQYILIFGLVPYAPISTRRYKRMRWQLHSQWVVLQEKNSELSEPKSFVMGHNHDWSYALKGNILASKAVCYYKHLWKYSLTQRVNLILFTTYVETLDPSGNFRSIFESLIGRGDLFGGRGGV